MSSEAIPTVPAETSSKDVIQGKIEKCLEQYRLKIKKLQVENERLKAINADLKSANSRVRRIPRKTGSPEQPVST